MHDFRGRETTVRQNFTVRKPFIKVPLEATALCSWSFGEENPGWIKIGAEVTEE